MSDTESKELIVVQTLTPAAVFVDPGGVDAIVARVKKEIDAFKPDISTPAGRAAIASFAFKIAKTKTGIEAMGKDLVAETKRSVKKIDTERARLWDELEALQKAARKPLDDYETAEANRIVGHENRLRQIDEATRFALDEPSAAIIRERIGVVEGWRTDVYDWQEFAARGEMAFADAFRALNSKLTAQVQREAERAELEAFRKAETERLQKENDERIAKEAADRATREAEEKAAREKAEADRVAKAEQDRLTREADEAKQRAEQAECDRVAAEKRATEAAAKAVADEQARVAAAKKSDDEAAAARAKDRANRDAKNMAAAAAIDRLTVRGKDPWGDGIVEAIAAGKIPHVTISY